MRKIIKIVSLSIVFVVIISVNSYACHYGQTHRFFCEVGSKVCEEYIALARNYFLNELDKHNCSKYYSEEKITKNINLEFDNLFKDIKNHKKEENKSGDCDVAPVIEVCYKGCKKSFEISISKISDPVELKIMRGFIGSCSAGEAGIPTYKKAIYEICIADISEIPSVETSEILEGLYKKLQNSDILFRAQIIGAALWCYKTKVPYDLAKKDKDTLRLKESEIIKRQKTAKKAGQKEEDD